MRYKINKLNNIQKYSYHTAGVLNLFVPGSTFKTFQRQPGSTDPAIQLCQHWLGGLPVYWEPFGDPNSGQRSALLSTPCHTGIAAAYLHTMYIGTQFFLSLVKHSANWAWKAALIDRMESKSMTSGFIDVTRNTFNRIPPSFSLEFAWGEN